MPFILSRPVHPSLPELWREGAPYQRTNIYDGCRSDTSPAVPPVHYDAHILRPHSLAHADAPAHIIDGGKTIDSYFDIEKGRSPFWGPATVARIDVKHFKEKVCRVSLELLKEAIQSATGRSEPPSRLLLTADGIPAHPDLGHDPDWVLVLQEDAARWLVSSPAFVLFGTSWKSTDFMPGSRERPIHKILFEKAILFECLDLLPVPPGEYFWVGAPLRLVGASEAPACPLLFRKEELQW